MSQIGGTRWTMFSGGEGSFRAAKIDRARNPDARQGLLFTDTLYEDADTYRFLIEAAANVLERRINWTVRAEDFPDYRVGDDVPIESYKGNPEWREFLADLRLRTMAALPELVWIVEGRDPWEIFRDEKFIVNSQIDPCSKKLKREHLDRWRKTNCVASADTFAVGIGSHESHRFDNGQGAGLRARMAKQGWLYHAPLIDAEDEINAGTGEHLRLVLAPVADIGVQGQRLYRYGYKHANCGGMCGKAGHAHWQARYREQPERFAYDAMMERKVRAFIGDDRATMLNDRRGGGPKRPMTLDAFAQRLDASPQIIFPWRFGEGGCGCLG
jgi:hypothetical protein